MPLIDSAKVDDCHGTRHEIRHDSTQTISDETRHQHSTKQRGSLAHPPHPSRPGAEHWDTAAEWTEEEERVVIRKIDRRLLLCFCIMIFGMALDKGNLANALTDGLLDDLNLSELQFNNAVMILRIAFCLSQVIVQCFVLKYGFKAIFPWMVMAWGTVSWAQAFCTGETSFYATRFLIGGLEGGFLPGVALFLSFFYTSKELPVRLAVITAIADIAHACSGLLAAGILNMAGLAGRPGWFWLFIIEGTLVSFIGLFSLLYLPESPVHTESRLCPKPWFTEREQVIVINRLLRDDPSKATSAPGFPRLKDVFEAARDSSFWGLYLVALLGYIPSLPVKQYAAINIRRLGFSTFHTNLLLAPAAIIQLFTVLGVTKSSRYFDERTWHCVFAVFYNIPLLAALEVLPDGGSPWTRYSVSTLIMASPTFGPIVTGWISENSLDVRKRAMAISILSAIGLLGAIASTHIYHEDNEPYYRTGNKALLSIAAATIFVLIGTKCYLTRLNRRKDRMWDGMGEEERKGYVEDDLQARERDGNHRRDFRFTT